LKDSVPTPGPKASMSELESIDESQRLELDLQGSEERMMLILQNVCFVLEGIFENSNKFPAGLQLDLHGMGPLSQTPEFKKRMQPLVVETSIEHPELMQFGLWFRWVQALGNLIYEVNMNNMLVKAVQIQKNNTPVAADGIRKMRNSEPLGPNFSAPVSN